MAATLATTDRRSLVAAFDRLTPGSVAYNLVADALDFDYDEDGSDAYVRHLENRGSYYAGSHEEAIDKAADSDFPAPPAW